MVQEYADWKQREPEHRYGKEHEELSARLGNFRRNEPWAAAAWAALAGLAILVAAAVVYGWQCGWSAAEWAGFGAVSIVAVTIVNAAFTGFQQRELRYSLMATNRPWVLTAAVRFTLGDTKPSMTVLISNYGNAPAGEISLESAWEALGDVTFIPGQMDYGSPSKDAKVVRRSDLAESTHVLAPGLEDRFFCDYSDGQETGGIFVAYGPPTEIRWIRVYGRARYIDHHGRRRETVFSWVAATRGADGEALAEIATDWSPWPAGSNWTT